MRVELRQARLRAGLSEAGWALAHGSPARPLTGKHWLAPSATRTIPALSNIGLVPLEGTELLFKDVLRHLLNAYEYMDL
jgi:hypothetical protein